MKNDFHALLCGCNMYLLFMHVSAGTTETDVSDICVLFIISPLSNLNVEKSSVQ